MMIFNPRFPCKCVIKHRVERSEIASVLLNSANSRKATAATNKMHAAQCSRLFDMPISHAIIDRITR
jgi:hypothetical protein